MLQQVNTSTRMYLTFD